MGQTQVESSSSESSSRIDEHWTFAWTLALAAVPWAGLEVVFRFVPWGPSIGPLSPTQAAIALGLALETLAGILAFRRLRRSLAYGIPLAVSLSFIGWAAALLGFIPLPGDGSPAEPVVLPSYAERAR